MEFSQRDIASMYDELRRLVRGTRFGRAGTLSGTALTNEALARLFRSARPDAASRQAAAPLVFENKEHLLRAFFSAVKSARISHHERNARHNPIDVLRTNVLLYAVEGAARFPELEDLLDVAQITVLHRLLDELRSDEHVGARERIARGIELRVLGGLPKHEVARMLGVARSTVDADHAFFQRWASVHVAHDRAELVRALDRLREDRNVREAELVARAAELALLDYQPEARVAATLGRTVADVRRWLAFLRGYLDRGPSADAEVPC
ncbi:MAG TPA: ECF-type sigma factor [Anaeromyxobacteraceae bacterium]|nr:ECF-type sigma factor [Anaeromyxobacteraceae bacterium]